MQMNWLAFIWYKISAKSIPDQIIAITFSLLNSKSVLVSIPWNGANQLVFPLSGGPTTNNFFPSLETFNVEAIGNTSDGNSFSQYDRGNYFRYLKQNVIKTLPWELISKLPNEIGFFSSQVDKVW